MPVKRFPGGGRVNPGGVANETDDIQVFDWEQTALSWIDKQGLGNMSLWGVFGGETGKNGLYTYGRRNKEQPFVMNLEYQLEVDEIGAVASVNGVKIMSYRLGNDFGVKAVDPTTKAIAVYEGLEFRPKRKLPADITPWKSVMIECDPLPSGSSIEFWYRNKPTDDFVKALLADGSNNYAVTNGINALFRIGSHGLCFEPRVVLTPSGNESPEIRSITPYFN